MRRILVVLIAYSVLALANLFFFVTRGQWLNLFGALVCLFAIVADLGRYSSESRRAAKDHRGPYPAPGGSSGSITTYGPIRPGSSAFFPGVTIGALRAAQRGAADPSVTLPTERSDELIPAWKVADLALVESSWRFRGVGQGAFYGAEEHAVCLVHEDIAIRDGTGQVVAKLSTGDHRPPEVDCQCGFYAQPSRVDALNRFGMLLLEVELGGRIVEGDNNVYRAEFQRVLAAYVKHRCTYCSTPGELFVEPNGNHPDGGHDAILVDPSNQSITRTPHLEARCAVHVGAYDAPHTLGQLSGALGTEVRTMPDDWEPKMPMGQF